MTVRSLSRRIRRAVVRSTTTLACVAAGGSIGVALGARIGRQLASKTIRELLQETGELADLAHAVTESNGVVRQTIREAEAFAALMDLQPNADARLSTKAA